MNWVLWNWVKSLFNRPQQATTPGGKAFLASIEYEEEALKRLKRIAELREELYRASEKNFRKRLLVAPEGTEEEVSEKDLNNRYTWPID